MMMTTATLAMAMVYAENDAADDDEHGDNAESGDCADGDYNYDEVVNG